MCLTQYNTTTVKELDTQQVVVRLNNAVYTVVEVILGMTLWLNYHNVLDAMENIKLTHVNALWYSMHDVRGPLLPCNCLGATERMHLRGEHFLGCFSGDFCLVL